MRLKLQKQADFLNVGLAHHLDSDSFNVVPCGGKWSVGDNDFLSLQGFHTTDGVSEITML